MVDQTKRLLLISAFLVILATGLIMLWTPYGVCKDREVFVIELEGPINPAGATFLVRGLEKAEKQQAVLVVIRLDTPGGLDTSLRSIIKGILASPVPVCVYVAPQGAWAGSAGTFITIAGNVAAMACV